jgi:hypothetical protein
VREKIRLTEIRVGDVVEFSSPGLDPVVGKVAEIVPLHGGYRKSMFMDAEGTLLNPKPDGGTDAFLVEKGPLSPEEIEHQLKYDEGFEKFSTKPAGSMYMLSSHKSTGTILIKISDKTWIYYDYSGYGGYESYTMSAEQAFSNCWDSTDAIFWADEMEVKGI